MPSTSVSAAKNRMSRAVDSIIDPWPKNSDAVWEFFNSECAYCGTKLVRAERLGHIDHATAKGGNHLGNLVLSCSVCNGDEKLDMGWREFLDKKVKDSSLRGERVHRIEQWQALHPQPILAGSNSIVDIESDLREMITAFGERCADLRAAVAGAKSAHSDSANARTLAPDERAIRKHA